MRMKLFRLILDGTYVSKQSATKKRQLARNRILVVTCKMRFFTFDDDDWNAHGGGNPKDQLTVMSVHLHYCCAKKFF